MQIRLLALASGASLLLAQGAARADAPLGLEDVVRMALAQNERSLKTAYRVEAAVGAVDRARAAFLPTITATGTGQLHAPVQERLASGNGLVQLSQPILTLSAFPLYSQARHQLESERWGAVEDRRLLAFDTARAFTVVLTNDHLYEAAVQRLERAKADQQNAEALARAEISSTNDVTRAVIETASAASQVAQTKGNAAKARSQLGFLVGQPVPGALATPDRTIRAAETGGFRMEDMTRTAAARRPDVRSAEERTNALQEFAKEPLYRLAPTLTAQAQLHAVVDPLAPTPAVDETVQLTVGWTIYDGGVRYADRKTRLAQADSQALDERMLKRSIASDIDIGFAALIAARETYRIATDAAEAARRNTEETGVLYKQGLAHAIEVTDANASRYEAEVTRENAQLSMEQAYLDLRYTRGLDPIEDDPELATTTPVVTAPTPDVPAAQAPTPPAVTKPPSAPPAPPAAPIKVSP